MSASKQENEQGRGNANVADELDWVSFVGSNPEPKAIKAELKAANVGAAANLGLHKLLLCVDAVALQVSCIGFASCS